MALLPLVVCATLLTAAPPAPAVPDSAGPAGALRMFVDCADCMGDIDFIRAGITFVDHVRDPQQADAYVLITTQDAANGGSEVTLTLMGRGAWAALRDTLRFTSKAADSDHTVEQEAVRLLRLGLARYAMRTPLAGRLDVSFAAPPAAPPRQPPDRWRSWVFTADLNGWFNGESSKRALNTWGSLTASRVGPVTKSSLTVGGSYYENRFDVEGGHILSVSRSRNTSARHVWGFGEHWSVEARAGAYTSTYSNMVLDWSTGPSLEFNAFPYSQSTRRELRFDYYMTFHRARYEHETIYFKTAESLWRQGLEVTLKSREPWGSSSVTLSAFHYLHDLDKNWLNANGEVSLRVAEGLSFKVSGNASRVRDQISLSAQGATLEDILLARRQLATQYQYYVSVGIKYTFGSIYSNIVNTRFGS